MHRYSRRSFLKTATGALAAVPFISRIPRPTSAVSNFDPSFGTVSQAVRAIRTGVISSRELTEHAYKRIKKYNPKINAFVTLMEPQAMERARQADAALAAGTVWGPLHGLPIVIKDAYTMAGVRTTSGSKTLENYIPKEDAVAVARLKQAGAILIGKTNLPEFSGDWQSYNDVVGTTNNPWDLSRTSGGSTGGGAAALAAGLGFLELGSDIGGSIRVPSHFCGIYGHKPTLNVVPLEGHIPPVPGGIAAVMDLNVAGPMARSAQDLRLALEIMAGPTPTEAQAYRWNLPPARGSRLKDYRIGYVLNDPFCPLTHEVAEILSKAIDTLRQQGVELTEGWPPGMNPQPLLDNYLFLLAARRTEIAKAEELQRLRDSINKPWGYYVRKRLEGLTATHRDWLIQNDARLKARALWQEYFKTHDAFLMPISFVPAIPHDHSSDPFQRTITTLQGQRLYRDLIRWPSIATLTGCPATVAPVGRTKGGLPVGLQIMGPFLEDATPIDMAGRMADVLGGFEIPPGYSG